MNNPLSDEKSENLKNMAFCKLHCGSRYCYLNLLQDKESFICSQCLFSLQDGDEKVDFSKKVDLIEAYQKPQVLLSKLIESKEKKNWIGSIFNLPDEEIVKQFDQQIHQLAQLTNNINRWIQNLNDQRLQIIKARDSFSQIISDIIQFPKFKQLLIQLSNDQNSSLDAIRQIEKDVQLYLRELKKDNCRPLIQKFDESIAQYHIKFAKIPIYEVNQFKTEFDKFSVAYQNFQKSIQQTLTPMGNLLQPTFKQTVLNQISKNLNKEINYLSRIYSSNEDGLNFDAMWKKIQEKKDLLFVFRTGFEGVFGAFTPCKWQNNGQHGLDYEGGSFLFSQNQQTIYRIKETHKKWAQYFNGSLLIFGGTWKFDEDLSLSKNFQDGFSKLGTSYYAQNLDGTKPSEVLFQGKYPNIKELEIYQIK